MKPTQNEIKDDIKAFVKIKESNCPLDNPYIEISSDNNIVTLNKDVLNKIPKVVQFNYEANKVFDDKHEYSYIYENVTVNCISNAINGINTCFFSYGETNSEKHSLIFGSNKSYDNITERGIFPRLIEALLSNNNVSIAYSLMCVNFSHLIDMTHFFNKDLNSLSAEDFITQSFEIKQSQNIISNITKVPIKSQNELNALIKEFNTLYDYLYNIEPLSSQYKLSTSSHFLYVIYLYNKANINQLISNISLCELSGQDKLVTKITNPNNSTNASIFNTKVIIDNTYTNECIKKSIKNLKLSRPIGDKYIDPSIEHAKILIVMQNLSFTFESTKFILIGCILHNVGMHEIAKNVLQFLFDCRKIIDEKRQLDEDQTKSMEKTKDDLIFKLQARCLELDKENKQMVEIIKSKNDLISNTRNLYKKQIDKIKELFCFEGDINVLLGGSQNNKEMQSVLKIQNAVNGIDVTKQRNKELTQEVNELKIKLKMLNNKSELILNDQTMLKYINTAKDKNQNEIIKLKMTFDHSQQMINLKEENEKLKQVNEEYQNELQIKYDIIKKFPKAFEINKEHMKTRKEIRDELRLKQGEKNKNVIQSYQMNYDKEIAQITKRYEGFLKEKDDRIDDIRSSYNDLLLKHTNEKDILNKEMIILYEMIIELISGFKTEFNWKQTPHLSVIHYNRFIVSRDNVNKLIERAEFNLNMTSLPETMKLTEGKKGNKRTKAIYIEAFNTLRSSFKRKSTAIAANDDVALLHKENKELKKRIADMIELVNAKEDKCSSGDKEHVIGVNQKLVTKLEEMVNDNMRKEMVLNVHERVINKLNCENMTIKNKLRKKLITEKVDYPLPSSFKKASKNSDLLYKSKSTRDIITSYSYIKPNSKKRVMTDSIRLLSS